PSLFLTPRRPPRPTLFPYTTLFRSERQPRPSISAPPRIGPNPSDRPDIAPNTPMALARSAGSGNVVAMIAIATGLSIVPPAARRSEEHTSELQSRGHLVCRLLLEKK